MSIQLKIPFNNQKVLIPKRLSSFHFVKKNKETLQKIPQFHLISWGGNFVERHSFRTVSGDSSFPLENVCIAGNEGVYERKFAVAYGEGEKVLALLAHLCSRILSSTIVTDYIFQLCQEVTRMILSLKTSLELSYIQMVLHSHIFLCSKVSISFFLRQVNLVIQLSIIPAFATLNLPSSLNDACTGSNIGLSMVAYLKKRRDKT